MTPFFSVVIPLYNKARFIQNTINSVLSQIFQDFEIIIVNDGSTDSSLARISSFNDKRISIFSTENKGVSHARNYGVSKSKAEYVAFLDADDFWHSSFLIQIKKLIERYPNESVFASALKIKTNKTTYNVSYKGLKQNENDIVDYFGASQDHSILHCSSSVFKKQALIEIGSFDENLNTGEDTDFWIRTGLKYNIAFINKPLAIHQVVGNGLTKTNRTAFKAIDFSKYDSLVSENPFAQHFLNQNKFASAIRFQLLGDKKSFNTIKKQINQNQLSTKRKILLALPKSILKFMVNVNNKMSSKKNYF